MHVNTILHEITSVRAMKRANKTRKWRPELEMARAVSDSRPVDVKCWLVLGYRSIVGLEEESHNWWAKA